MFKESFIITEYIGSTVDEQFKFIKIFTALSTPEYQSLQEQERCSLQVIIILVQRI